MFTQETVSGSFAKQKNIETYSIFVIHELKMTEHINIYVAFKPSHCIVLYGKMKTFDTQYLTLPNRKYRKLRNSQLLSLSSNPFFLISA